MRITDGSLPVGVYARSYSDGRIVGNAAIFRIGTGNANQAAWAHELGHCLGFDHVSGTPSVMNTPITYNANYNDDSPTAYDRSEYARKWGTGSQGSPGDGSGTGGGSGGGGTTTETNEPREPQYETVELGYKVKTGMLCLAPKIIRKRDELRYTWWLLHTPLSGGTQTWYRFIPGGRTRGSEYFDNRGADRRGITVHGFSPDAEPRNLRIRAVQEEPPEEDASVVEAPDPTSVPDVPGRAGQRILDPGSYLVSVQGVLEDGTLTKESEPVEKTIALNQMLRVSPVQTVSLLRNAEFARLDAQGKPSIWTAVNIDTVATNTYSTTEGVLTIEAAVPTSFPPRFDSGMIPVGSDTVLTVSGNLGADSTVQGAARVALRQYDEAGVYISDLTVASIEQGQVGDIEFKRLYAAADRHESCAFVALSPRISGTTVQGKARFWNLKVLPFDADVRKYDASEAGFDPPPDTPVSGSSFVAFGTPVVPAGLTPQDPEPPLDVVTFFGASPAWTAGWAFSGTATQSVASSGAIFGTGGWSVSDQSNTRRNGYYEKTFAAASDSLALRFLLRTAQPPTRGSVVLASLGTSSDNVAAIKYDSSGRLYLIVYIPATKKTYTYYLTSAGVGSVLDVEVLATGAETEDETIVVSIGSYPGGRRVVHSSSGRDFRGMPIDRARVGVYSSTEALAKWTLHYDQIALTRHGDVPNRERPSVPPGYTPPPVDRPTKGGLAREFAQSLDDPSETLEVRQGYLFFVPGEAPPNDPATIELLDEPFAVKPGAGYTIGMFLRFSVFTPEGNPAPGIRVWLEGEPGPSSPPPILVASLGEMTGKRGWHPATRPEEDEFATFTVPEIQAGDDGRPLAYTRARVEAVLHDGVYVFQEPLFSQEAFATFTEREAKRGWGRATSGEATFILDSKPEAWELGIPRTPVHWSELGVKTEDSIDLPAGVSVQPYYSISRDLLSYSIETPDPREIGPGGTAGSPERYLRCRLAFTGDGRLSPKVPTGGVYLRTWHPDAVLLREDGTHFPGVAYVSKVLFASSYPDVEPDSVAGHFLGVRESEDIGRLREIEITVSTEAAAREIERLSLQEELRVEVPTAGGTEPGEAYLIRLREQPQFAAEDVAPRVIDGHRRMLFRASVAEAEVLEAAPMLEPLPVPVPLPSARYA